MSFSIRATAQRKRKYLDGSKVCRKSCLMFEELSIGGSDLRERRWLLDFEAFSASLLDQYFRW